MINKLERSVPLVWSLPTGVPTSVEANCAVCAHAGRKLFRVRTFLDASPLPLAARKPKPLDFYTCTDCGTVFPFPFSQPEYDNDYGYPDWARLYAQVGAGIEFMTRPIIGAHRIRPVRAFVDAGCGFGFTVDFARRVLGAKALGLDPSAYARKGAQVLGIDILPRYLGSTPLPYGMKADLLLCSEVIEHVENPDGFARMLRDHLCDGGVLALTTPDAACIRPDNAPLEVMVALFAGYHRQVFNSGSLAATLQKAGFVHTHIIQLMGRLIAFASDDPIISAITLVPERQLYHRYLELLVHDGVSEHSDVRQGALFRLLAEYSSYGDWANAERVTAQLDEILQQEQGLSLTRPEEVAARLAVVPTLPALPAYWLPAALYFVGMLNLNGRRDATTAQRNFAAAHRCMAVALRLNLLSEAGLYWQAVLHEGIAALANGDNLAAVDTLSRLVASRASPSPELLMANLPPALVARAHVQRGVARIRLNDAARAIADLAMGLEASSLLSEDEATMAHQLLLEAASRLIPV